jgi:hypothetical protein
MFKIDCFDLVLVEPHDFRGTVTAWLIFGIIHVIIAARRKQKGARGVLISA